MMHPGERFPALTLRDTDGGDIDLTPTGDDVFILLIIYRWLHCSMCRAYLQDLAAAREAFVSLGVRLIAASAEGVERAVEARRLWTEDRVTFAHSLSADDGRRLRLFRSSARKPEEPAAFFEPALFLIDRDRHLRFVSLQNMPFGRPPVQDLLTWIPKIDANNIPARGTLRY